MKKIKAFKIADTLLHIALLVTVASCGADTMILWVLALEAFSAVCNVIFSKPIRHAYRRVYNVLLATLITGNLVLCLALNLSLIDPMNTLLFMFNWPALILILFLQCLISVTELMKLK